ncbi:MAG: pteridine reductase, partial [Gammaproteobacteria bacterium]
MLLSGKTALVTGAANRIGAEIVRTLHDNGANLIIHYRHSKSEADSLCNSLNLLRPESAKVCQADLNSQTDRDRLVSESKAAFQNLHLLINNASAFYATPIGSINEDNWQDLSASNFKAPLFLIQALAPELTKTGGSIINMLDIYAANPLVGHSLYCASKAANQSLVQSLALELAPEVRINGIAPGAILWPEQSDSARAQEILNQIPLKRIGNP